MNLETIIAFIPLTVLIIGALTTKRIAETMVVASFLGAVFLYKSNFFSGYIDMIYQTLSNSSYQFVLIILMGFGGMIKLLQESGALLGFGSLVHKFAKGPKKPLIVSWIMALIMFVDDYLSTLAISFSMKDITDKNGIPREHLAYQSNSIAACFCVLIPFSSWTAFNVGLISEQGLSYSDYIHALPYMFYPIIAAVTCLILDFGLIPKVGVLKSSPTSLPFPCWSCSGGRGWNAPWESACPPSSPPAPFGICPPICFWRGIPGIWTPSDRFTTSWAIPGGFLSM